MHTPLPAGCAIVCHDAGAANILRAWDQADRGSNRPFFADGPAAILFADSPERRRSSIEEVLEGVPALVSGTGWASAVEHHARRLAKDRGLHSIAVLDHWVNYRERFERDGQTVLPDEIWVTDRTAFDLARAAFPGTRVLQQPNYYLDSLLREILRPPLEPATDVLVILEPLRENWQGRPASEFEVLDRIARCLPGLGLAPATRIRLRPHPSDPPGKYNAWAQAHEAQGFETAASIEPLSMAIRRAALVIGCHSYAMAVALHAGKRVACALPPHAMPCRLPLRGIEALRCP